MKRKIAVLSLILALCVSLFPTSASATYEHNRRLMTETEDEVYQFVLDHLEEIAQGKTVTIYKDWPIESWEDDNRDFKDAIMHGVTFYFEYDHPEVIWGTVKLKAAGGSMYGGAMHYHYDIGADTVVCYWPAGSHRYAKGRDLWEDYQWMVNKAEELAAECRAAGPSRYDQLLYLHDWLITHNAYNKPIANATWEEEEELDPNGWSHKAISALREDMYPVCEGYTRAFHLVCNALDIPCFAMGSGGAFLGGALHNWNWVQMENGKWYYVDVTWDDPVPTSGDWNRLVSGLERHDYFLRGGKSFWPSHGGADDHLFAPDFYPEMSYEDYDPATKPTAPVAPSVISSGMPRPEMTGTALQSTQMVSLDGKAVELQAYALKNAAGNLTNYVKVRDVAAALDGTQAQFDVTWADGVNLITGDRYLHPNGQENQTPYSGDRAYTRSTAYTQINGEPTAPQSFIILDDDGKGSTYYKLRDLAQLLGFNVGWSGERGIFIETDKPYDYSN